MRILSTGDSPYGCSVIYEHEGKVYSASGGSSAQAISQVVDAIANGKIFGTPVDSGTAEPEPEEDSQVDTDIIEEDEEE